MKLIKVLPESTGLKSTCANGVLRLVGINSASDVDGDVIMTNDCYNKIYNTTKKTASDSLKRLSVVKISANEKVIYRSYRGISASDFLSDYAALSPNSIRMLNDKDGNEPQDVQVSPGSIFPFYWYHPDKSVRLSAKLGLISLLLGVISIVVSCISLHLAIYAV